MLNSLQALLAPALSERLTLVINHVLAAEPVATQRLLPHAGRVLALRITGWPSLLPPPPALAWRVTPAGLLEWCGPEVPANPDLAVTLDAPNPALLLVKAVAGDMPPVQIDGDAQLAGDVNWLLQNVRWDVAADLEGLFGPTAAQQIHRVGSALAKALRSALNLAGRTAAGVAERMPPRGA